MKNTENQNKAKQPETDEKPAVEADAGKKSAGGAVGEGKSAVRANYNYTSIFTAVAFIIIGILFCAFRSGMLSILLTLVGVAAIAFGVFNLIRRKYAQGTVEIVVGIVVIACSWTIVAVTLMLLGIAFIAYGIYSIVQNAEAMKKERGFNKVLAILNPLLILIFGILLFAAYWAVSDAICIVLGVIAIITGILILIRK